MPARANFIRACKSRTAVLFTAWWCPEPTHRRVTQARSKDVAFSHPTREGVESWIDYPKASQIVEPEPGLFLVEPGTEYQLTYDFR